MIIKASKANGVMTAPPSKSMAHRHLICAALAEGRSVIHNIDLSEDIKATLSCIKQLGASAEVFSDSIVVSGAGAVLSGRLGMNTGSVKEFNCNESGSTLRFFIPLAMLSGEKSFFTGSEVLMTRPMSVYEDICRKQNISFQRKNGGIEVEGKLHSDSFSIPGNISSQFITGLLFTLPFLDGDSTITLTESIESKPYIDMTLQVQQEFGIKAQWISDNVLAVPGNQMYRAADSTVEGDYSNAAFLEAFNCLGGSVIVQGLREDSLQGDKVYLPYFMELQKGFATIDISDCPDLGPVLFTLAACLHGGEFTGTKRLKIKESDRGAVMCEELARFGVKTQMEDNRIIIYKGSLKSPYEPVQGHNDHRIVMSMATLLSVTGGRVEGAGAVRKSLPDYFKRIRLLGIEVEPETIDEEKLLLQ